MTGKFNPNCFCIAKCLLLLLSMGVVKVNAQAKIDIHDIQKIHFVDAEGALGFSRQTEFELVRLGREWVCNQTKQQYQREYLRPGDKEYFDKEHAAQQKFIKTVDEKLIVDFLKSIAVIKLGFDASLFGITPQRLISEADTSQNLKYYKEKGYGDITRIELSKQQYIPIAIDTLQKSWHTDDYPTCLIQVVMNNNDTVKVETHRQVDYMLPWKVNGVDSYDLSINHFFIAVMGEYRFSAKIRLAGDYLPDKIVRYIFDNYVQIAKIKQEWQTRAPTMYTNLQANFNMVSARRYGGYKSDDYNECQLNPVGAPRNLIITAGMFMNDFNFLDQLLVFRDSIKGFWSDPNFVIKYYSGKSANIKFNWWAGGKSSRRLSDESKKKFKLLQKDYPEYDVKKVRFMSIEEGYQHFTSTWMLLPDSKLVLLSFMKPDIAGLKGNPLNSTSTYLQYSFVLFDKDGAVVKRY